MQLHKGGDIQREKVVILVSKGVILKERSSHLAVVLSQLHWFVRAEGRLCQKTWLNHIFRIGKNVYNAKKKKKSTITHITLILFSSNTYYYPEH